MLISIVRTSAAVVTIMVALLYGGQSCTSSNSKDVTDLCTLEQLPAVRLVVLDATNQRPICNATATIYAASDGSTWPMGPFPGATCSYVGGRQPADTYTVKVSAAGYVDAETTVSVTAKYDYPCSPTPNTANVTIYLNPT